MVEEVDAMLAAFEERRRLPAGARRRPDSTCSARREQ
jgi:hypothetical protein